MLSLTVGYDGGIQDLVGIDSGGQRFAYGDVALLYS